MPRVAVLVALVATVAAALALGAHGARLRVGVINETEPFVMQTEGDDSTLTGFDIDLLKAVLLLEPSIGKYSEVEFVHFHTLTGMLRALRHPNGTRSNGVIIDVGVSAVVANDPEDQFIDFSTPYFTSGLQILVANRVQRESVVQAFMNAPLIQFIFCIFIIFLVMFAHCIWICERWSNKDFRPSYLEGVSDGFWWAAVTTGTVGYGDKTPKSPLGKTLTIILMFWSMIMTSLLIAGVTSVLTATIFISGPTGPGSLSGLRVGLVRGRASVSYCKANLAAELIVFDSLSKAVAALEDSELDAVVDDTPRLVFHAEQAKALRVVGEMFDPHRYAFAFPEGSPLKPFFSSAIERLDEGGDINILYRRWISQLDAELDRESKATVDPSWVTFVMILASIICVTSILTCIAQFLKRAFVDRNVKPTIPTREGAMSLMKDMLNAGLARPAASIDSLFSHEANPFARDDGPRPMIAPAPAPRQITGYSELDGVPLEDLTRPSEASEVATLRALVADLRHQVEILSIAHNSSSGTDIYSGIPAAARLRDPSIRGSEHMELLHEIK